MRCLPAPSPRLYCIPATAAPVVAVIRRGPSAWTQIGRWDIDRGTYDAGAWVRARIYPERCDLSPDGRWLVRHAGHRAARVRGRASTRLERDRRLSAARSARALGRADRRARDGEAAARRCVIDIARARLVVATTDGRVQIRAGAPPELAVEWETDLAPLEPNPQPPPREASQW